MKLYTLFRIERTKTIPCPAAHPRIVHIRDCPAAPGLFSRLVGDASRSSCTERFVLAQCNCVCTSTLLNVIPFYIFVSEKVISVSDISAVNFTVE